MIPTVTFSSLRNARWWQFAVRFVLGGAVTACTGLVAQHWGPIIGGLFLSFPAIFPASATISVEAVGSAIGSIGLLAWALLAWKFLPAQGTWTVLTAATLVWLAVSVVLWEVRKLA